MVHGLRLTGAMSPPWPAPLFALAVASCAFVVVPPEAPPSTVHLSTPPTDGAPPRFRLVSEAEPAEEVLLAWEGNWEHGDYFHALVGAIADEVPVRLVGDEETVGPLAEWLLEEGIPPDRLRRLEVPVDTMWIRDYGPLLVHSVDDLVLVDPPYHKDRPRDDVMSVALARAQARLRLPLELPIEGGHLLADGDGRCVVSEDVLAAAMEDGAEEPAVRARMAAVLGCDEVVFVLPLLGEETGHVDMFVMLPGPGRALVGAYTRGRDELNAEVLDEAALRLEEGGFEVTRIPMPSSSGRTVFRSYLNSIVLERSVIVPVYRGSRRSQAEALAILRSAYPGRRVVPIEAEEVAELGGAIHCTALVVPRVR